MAVDTACSASLVAVKLACESLRRGECSVAHDGGSNGLTAPISGAQREVIVRARAAAGVEASSIEYVEAHGTGTRLGDPIELSSIAAIYGNGRAAGAPCRGGSVKTNIGHLEAAAGIAGLVKTA